MASPLSVRWSIVKDKEEWRDSYHLIVWLMHRSRVHFLIAEILVVVIDDLLRLILHHHLLLLLRVVHHLLRTAVLLLLLLLRVLMAHMLGQCRVWCIVLM